MRTNRQAQNVHHGHTYPIRSASAGAHAAINALPHPPRQLSMPEPHSPFAFRRPCQLSAPLRPIIILFYPPPQLANPDQTSIRFEFECPITEMLRVATLSETCQDPANVALSYEPNNGVLADTCNGDRHRRISSSLAEGSAILGSMLATDGTCLDKVNFGRVGG